MERCIADLPLPHFLKKALRDKEYTTVADLAAISAADLALELSIGVPQAEDILRATERLAPEPSVPSSQLHSSTAAELLQSANRIRFSTLSSSLDDLIGDYAPRREELSGNLNLKGKYDLPPGSICPGMVVELSGPPGSGKSAISVGVVISARLREESPEVLLVDTEGSVPPDRICTAMENVLEGKEVGPIRDILAGIHFIRVPTQMEMVALLHTLDLWLEAHPKVKLLVIDSLSFHFRQPTLELGAKKRIMDMVKKVVGQAATVHGCAVVVTTQLATKLLTSDNQPANFDTGDRAVLMPQLGDGWTTERTIRVTLFRGPEGDDLRYAHATTVGSEDDAPWASFDIDNVGLPCDVPPEPEDEGEVV